MLLMNTALLLVIAIGSVTVLGTAAILLSRDYRQAASVEHLQEVCGRVAALREAAAAFPGKVENDDWSEGDNPSQLTSAGVDIAYSVLITGFGPLHVISFSLGRGTWPWKRRVAGCIFGAIERQLCLREVSRGWANPVGHLYYLVFLERDGAIARAGLNEVPDGPSISEVKRSGIKPPAEGRVVYLRGGDDSPSSNGLHANEPDGVIRKALGADRQGGLRQ